MTEWHQLDHMQTICTSLQTDNHTSTSSLIFTDWKLFLTPNKHRRHWSNSTVIYNLNSVHLRAVDVLNTVPCSTCMPVNIITLGKKGKVFPYSLPSVGPGADPRVQAVSPQVTWSESRHIPSSSLSLLSARPAFTFVALTRWRYL